MGLFAAAQIIKIIYVLSIRRIYLSLRACSARPGLLCRMKDIFMLSLMVICLFCGTFLRIGIKKMGDISKYFSRKEFSCECGCGFAAVDVELLKVLEDVRTYFFNPVIINSGCRCMTHNKAIGGSKKSKHILGIAADIVVENIPAEAVYYYLEKKYPNKYGIGRYDARTHIDIRLQKARWNERIGH